MLTRIDAKPCRGCGDPVHLKTTGVPGLCLVCARVPELTKRQQEVVLHYVGHRPGTTRLPPVEKRGNMLALAAAHRIIDKLEDLGLLTRGNRPLVEAQWNYELTEAGKRAARRYGAKL
jgi:DNA-binding MarR family transcriptional regulator